MGPTWGPPGSCQPQMGPMLAPWTLLSGCFRNCNHFCVGTWIRSVRFNKIWFKTTESLFYKQKPSWLINAPWYSHDKTMTCNHFSYYWPFVRWNHWKPVASLHKEPVIQNFNVFCCWPGKPVEQTIKLLVIWDKLILLWCHGNEHRYSGLSDTLAVVHLQSPRWTQIYLVWFRLHCKAIDYWDNSYWIIAAICLNQTHLRTHMSILIATNSLHYTIQQHNWVLRAWTSQVDTDELQLTCQT